MLYFKICVSYPTKFRTYSMISLIRVVGCLNTKICVYVISEISFAARRSWRENLNHDTEESEYRKRDLGLTELLFVISLTDC